MDITKFDSLKESVDSVPTLPQDKHINNGLNYKIRAPKNSKRSIYLSKEVIKGRTYLDIGKELDLSANRVMQLFWFVMRASNHASLKLGSVSFNLKEIKTNKAKYLERVEAIDKHWSA